MSFRIALGIFSALVLSGCSVLKKPSPGDPAFSPVAPESYSAPAPQEGSIYRDNYGLSLWSDSKASRIGDVLTIILDESTDSSKTAKTEISKEDTNALSVTQLLGTIPTWKGNQFLNSATDNTREFGGESKSSQNNALAGSLSVTVAKVLPNGNMIVRGEKWITLTDGKEYLRLTGIVRPFDVTPDNRILSSRVADAKIEYSGTGAGADSNRVGWASRIFMSDWWPF